MKHTYTEEEKEKIAQMLFDFLREHGCFGGEHFAQDDTSQIDSIDFMCDLADIKDVTEIEQKIFDGDVVVAEDEIVTQMFIVKNCLEPNEANCYIGYEFETNTIYNAGNWGFDRIATEEEKQKLFDAIKTKGYKWNSETKTLEVLVEPRFKVGDRITCIYNNYQYDIKELTDTHYTLVDVEDKFQYTEPISEDKNWKLVSNKFDITTLEPFESKVLVRSANGDVWRPAIYGFANSNKYYIVGGVYWEQCIPYEGNEHLLNTTKDCDEYYKVWRE